MWTIWEFSRTGLGKTALGGLSSVMKDDRKIILHMSLTLTFAFSFTPSSSSCISLPINYIGV